MANIVVLPANCDLEIGQVLSLRIRYNAKGDIAQKRHPYLVLDINDELNIVEIGQLSSVCGKEYKLLYKSNKLIECGNPEESVIDKDSYIQMDNFFIVENFPGLINFRRQTDKLSAAKLRDVIREYRKFQEENHIDENRMVFMAQDEILQLNM